MGQKWKDIYIVIWENREVADRTIDCFESEKEAEKVFNDYVENCRANWEKSMDFSEWTHFYYDYSKDVYIELEKQKLKLS